LAKERSKENAHYLKKADPESKRASRVKERRWGTVAIGTKPSYDDSQSERWRGMGEENREEEMRAQIVSGESTK